MGNLHTLPGILPSSQIKLKAGKRADSIPYPHIAESSSFEKLFKDCDFKDFVLKNIDNNALITSLLQKDEIYSSDIRILCGVDKSLQKELGLKVKVVQNLATLGAKINFGEMVSIFENELISSAAIDVSPFLNTFQKRLSVLVALESSVVNDKRSAQDIFRDREFVGVFLNSVKNPQLCLSGSMGTFSLSMIKLLPKLLDSCTNEEDKTSLLLPVQSLSDSLKKIDDNELYNSWAPRPSPPLTHVPLNISTAKASSGNAADAVNGQRSSYWSTTSSKGEWSIKLESKCNVVGIKISWIPLLMTNTVNSQTLANGAPKKLSVVINYTKSLEETAEFEKTKAYDPEYEFRKQGSWMQVYMLRVENATSIKLSMKKLASANQSASIRMYKFEVLRINNDAMWLDALAELNKTQDALLPLVKYDLMQVPVIDSSLAIIRSSGSLGLLLSFLKFIKESGVDEKLPSFMSSSIRSLMLAYHSQIAKYKFRISLGDFDSSEKVIDAVFDGTLKSSQITLLEGGLIASSNSVSNSYALLNFAMDDGVWTWEFILSDESHGDETTYLGVALKPSNTSMETSKQFWVIKCFTGETYHINKLHQPKSHAPIHPNDVCKFVYDVERMTVSLTVNDIERGIVFENVPPGVSPMAGFYSSEKKIKVTSVKYKPKPIDLIKPADISFAGPLQSLEEIKTAPSLSSLLLSKVSHLCESSLAYVQFKEKSRRSTKYAKLEYAYCVEVSDVVIKQLLDILEMLKNKYTSISIEAEKSMCQTDILSVINIMQTQFYCMKHSNVDVQEVGFKHKVVGVQNSIKFVSSESLELLTIAKNLLSYFMAFSDSETIRLAAVRAFAEGSILFLPNVEDKIEAIVLGLGNNLWIRNEENNNNSPDPVKVLLVSILVSDLTACANTLQMIKFYKIDHVDAENFRLMFDEATNLIMSTLISIEIRQITESSTFDFDVASARHLVSELCVQLVHDLISSPANDDHVISSSSSNTAEHMLSRISRCVFTYTSILIEIIHKYFKFDPKKSFKIDDALRDSSVGIILQPLLHMLCFCSNRYGFIQTLLPDIAALLKRLGKITQKCPWNIQAESMLYKLTPRTCLQSSSDSSIRGWHTIEASFEDDSSYTLNDTKNVYTSSSSSNTCALVSVIFTSKSKAAWEFKLDVDSNTDECSLFGVGTPNLSNRDYTKSPDLWMRRSYNGLLYARGQTVDGMTLEKIHPDDVIRAEFDGAAGTLSFSLNGAPPEVAFTGINEPISPACGSYRSGVQISLLKVEVYGNVEGADSGEDAHRMEPRWKLNADIMDDRDLSVAKFLNEKQPKAKDDPVKHATCILLSGTECGVHEWAFEVLDPAKCSEIFIGAVSGGDPHVNDHLAGLLSPYEVLGNALVSSDDEIANNFQSMHSMAWRLDGSLWLNGEQVNSSFGASFLPLKNFSSIVMRINREERSMSFSINGAKVGVAFGPPDLSEAVIKVPLQKIYSLSSELKLKKTSVGEFDNSLIYPAVSVSSTSLGIKIRNSGFNGSVVIPLTMSLHKTTASVLGRLSASLLKGTSFSKEEYAYLPWLQSPLMLGGLDSATDLDLFKTVVCVDKPKVKTEGHPSWATALTRAENCTVERLLQTHQTFQGGNMTNNSIVVDTLKPLKAEVISDVMFLSNLGTSSEFSESAHSPTTTFLTRLASSSKDSTDNDIKLLLQWLEKIEPEMAGLRVIFERKGVFSFPVCEYPYIACLLKHSGLVSEAINVANMLSEEKAEGESDEIAIMPSNDMILLWKKVQQLRLYLRKQRQALMANKESITSEAAEKSPAISNTTTEIVKIILDNLKPVSISELEATAHATTSSEIVLEDLSTPDIASIVPVSSISTDYVEALETAISDTSSSGIQSEVPVEVEVVETADPTISSVPNPADSTSSIISSGFITEGTVWLDQIGDNRSVYDPNYYCIIRRVGIDFSDEFLYIQFSVFGDNSLGELQPPQDSSLLLGPDDEEDDDSPNPAIQGFEVEYTKNDPLSEISGYMRYDINPIDILFNTSSSVSFEYGMSGYSRVTLRLPSQSSGSRITSDSTTLSLTAKNEPRTARATSQLKSITDFDQLCGTIRDRAIMLLKMNPAFEVDNASTPSKSQNLLLDMMDRQSTERNSQSSNGVPAATTLARDRWKRVIEFLRVHSAIRKESSSRQALSLFPASNADDSLTISLTSAEIVNDDTRSDHLNSIFPSEQLLEIGQASNHLAFGGATDSFDEVKMTSAAHAAIQACALFVTGESLNISLEEIEKSIERRTLRANHRIFALDCIRASIESCGALSDPFALMEVLMFIPSAFSSPETDPGKNINLAGKDVKDPKKTIDGNKVSSGETKIHYLINLEGCDMATLSSVQESFINLFTTISYSLSEYITVWEQKSAALCLSYEGEGASSLSSSFELEHDDPTHTEEKLFNSVNRVQKSLQRNSHVLLNPIRMLFCLWNINYSSRDYKFLIQCGFLPVLFKILSLSTFERVVGVSCNPANIFAHDVISKMNKPVETTPDGKKTTSDKLVSPYHADYIRQGLAAGTLNSRHIYINLLQSICSIRSFGNGNKEFDNLVAISGNTIHLNKHQSSLSYLLYMCELARSTIDKIVLDEKSQEEGLKTEKERKEKEKQDIGVNKMKTYGAFDATSHGNIKLSECNLLATTKNNGTGTVCAIFASVTYDVEIDPSTHYGNYFETEIVEAGPQDIGIGLADKSLFPTTRSMPGWEAHSYGYHGDDGHQFGRNGASQDWPHFSGGDIIGCGFDHEAKSIFYTRNGELLGIGFTDVTDAKLTPVIGFTNRHSSTQVVRINFGLKPFAYDGPEIIPNPKMLEHRDELIELLALCDKSPAEDSSVPGPIEALPNTESPELGSCSQIAISPDDINLEIIPGADNKLPVRDIIEVELCLKSSYAFISEYSTLRSIAFSLLRQLLLAIQGNDDTDRNPEGDIAADPLSAVTKTVLKRELSSFGTPKTVTLEDGVQLRDEIVSTVIQEIFIGARYIGSIPTFPNSSNSRHFSAGPEGKLLTAFVGKFSFSNLFKESVVDIGNQLFEDVNSGDCCSEISSSSDVSNQGTLEKFEVESVIFSHLQILCLLLPTTSYLKNELATARTMQVMFSLLTRSSSRLQLLVLRILRVTLHEMDPDEIDNVILRDWETSHYSELRELVDTLQNRPTGISKSPSSKSPTRRLPDTIVRVLILKIQQAITCTSEVCSKPVETSEWQFGIQRNPASKSLTHGHPIGFGNMRLENASALIALLRTLLASSKWSEIVACNLTDAFRNAKEILLNKNYSLLSSGSIFSKCELNTFEYACASASVICGIRFVGIGASVRVSDGSIGVVTSLSYDQLQADVLLSSQKTVITSDLSAGIITVPTRSLMVIDENLAIDFSNISQPLLAQVIELLKYLLKWFITQAKFRDESLPTKILTRLLGQLSNAITILFENNSDAIIDAIQDDNLIGDIMTLSISPVELPYCVNSELLTSMWCSVQSLLLESSKPIENGDLKMSEENFQPDNSINETTMSAILSTHASSFSSTSPHVGSDFLSYNTAERKLRQIESAKLASELEIDKQICLNFLEFNMMNIETTRESLLQFKDSISLIPLTETEKKESDDIRSRNPSSKVDFLRDAILVKTDEAPHAVVSSTLGNNSLICSRSMKMYLDDIPCNEPFQYPHILLIESRTSGVLDSPDGKIFSSSSNEFNSSDADVIVASYDSELGIPIFSAVEKSSLRLIAGIFDQNLFDIPKYSLNVDKAIAIVQMRTLASKIIASGSLDLSNIVEDKHQLVLLIKLITLINKELYSDANQKIPDQLKLSSAFSKILNAFLKKKQESVLNSSVESLDNIESSVVTNNTAPVVSLLINDMLSEIRDLTLSEIAYDSKKNIPSELLNIDDTDDQFSEFSISSPHPFVGPCTASGKIDIPSSWNGIVVSFDPRFSTPSKLASLHFFKSLKDFDDDKPCFSLSGPNPGIIHPFVSSDVQTLYFRFNAFPGANKPLLMCQPSNQVAKIIDDELSCESKGPVGLGSDDSLFNLFENISEDNKIGIASPFMEGISAGTWYFEISITAIKEERNFVDEISKFGWINDGFSVGSDDSVDFTSSIGCLIDADGAIFVNGVKTLNVSHLGDWKVGDCLGCYLSIVGEGNGGAKFSFSKNGLPQIDASGNPIEIEIKLKGPESLVTNSLKPIFIVDGGTKFKFNFGDSLFLHPPSKTTDPSWNSLLCRPTAKTSSADLDWGYEFKVRPFNNLNLSVCREFELVWKLKNDEGKAKPPGKNMWVWRPVPFVKEFCSLGDIVTKDSNPPYGCVLVDKKQCCLPVSYTMVCSSKELNLTVWRPIPPPGNEYIALGDIIVSNLNTDAPSKSLCVCVPAFAVEPSKLGERIFRYTKSTKDTNDLINIWSMQTDLGLFFGSNIDALKTGNIAASNSKDVSVGKPYRLLGCHVKAAIFGEWINEMDVVKSRPSISWALQLMKFFMESKVLKIELLNESVFSMIVQYLRSSYSPDPFRMLPIVILMLRSSYLEGKNIDLPIDLLKPLCTKIFSQTLSKVKKGDYIDLSANLVGLVDLVIELEKARMVSAMLSKGLLDILTPNNCTSSAANSTIEWWNRKMCLGSDEFEAISTSSVDSLISVENENSKDKTPNKDDQPNLTSMKYLHHAIEFFSSLHQRDWSTSPKPYKSSPVLPADKIIPTHVNSLAGEIWYDNLSNCVGMEYVYPSELLAPVEESIVFPGAFNVNINFDGRTSLRVGDVLEIVPKYGFPEIITSATKESVFTKGFQFLGSEIKIIFKREIDELSACSDENASASSSWGWGLLISAVGSMYELDTVFVDLTDASNVIASTSEEFASMCKSAISEEFNIIEDSVLAAADKLGNETLSSPVDIADVCLEHVRGMCPHLEGSCLKSHNENDVKKWAEDTESGGVQENVSSVPCAAPIVIKSGDTDEGERADDDELLRAKLIKKYGRLMSSGSSAVPLADTIDIKIYYIQNSQGTTSENEAIKKSRILQYSLSLSYQVQGAATSKVLVVAAEDGNIVTLPAMNTDSIDYAIYGVDSESFEEFFRSFIQIRIENKKSKKEDIHQVFPVLENTNSIDDEREENGITIVETDQSTTIATFAISHETVVSSLRNDGNSESFGNTLEFPLDEELEVLSNDRPSAPAVESETLSDSDVNFDNILNIIPQSDSEHLDQTEVPEASIEPLSDDVLASPAVAADIVVDSTDTFVGFEEFSISPFFTIDQWTCALCTVLNDNSSTICCVCESRRPDSSETDISIERETEAVTAGWWCTICTFINPLTSTSCVMCGTATETTAPSAITTDSSVDSTIIAKTDKAVTVDSLIEASSSPSRIELMFQGIVPKGKSGIVIKVTGSLSKENKFISRVQGCLAMRKSFKSGRAQVLLPNDILNRNQWSFQADTAILEYVNNKINSLSTKTFFSKPTSIAISKQHISYRASCLSHYSVMDIYSRVMTFQTINNSIESLIPIINLKNNDELSLGSSVRKYSRYLFMSLKQPILDRAIKATAVSSGKGLPINLKLDNMKSIESGELKRMDPSVSQCCFVQAFRQLQNKDADAFKYVFSGDRVFQITFVAESGMDAGGVYREGMSRICEDLFSPNFNLLLICPNGQHDVHVNIDKYIPNPQQTGPLALEMFEFVGKLMAISIRTKLYLPFEFPSIIWKKIVGEEVNFDDLMAIDTVTCRFIEALRNCEKDEIFDENSFNAKYKNKLKFVSHGSDGVESELIPGQRDRVVTYASRIEYCDAVLQRRLHEFDEQVAAISRGLDEVIPLRVLQLFSWQQLEVLVSGSPTFDIKLWKENTEGSISKQTLNLFWKVMESFTTKEQSGFIRFAWGRSRLPAAKDFTTKMKLTPAGGSSHQLPVSHTCFFSVELPEYKTEEEMRHGLLTAIHFGVGGILNG